MSNPLTNRRAEAYVAAMRGRAFAFVAVLPSEPVEGLQIQGALGLAIANDRGFMPVPLGWAYYETFTAAQDHAEHLNKHIGLIDDQASMIQISTMGGIRYEPPALPQEGP